MTQAVICASIVDEPRWLDVKTLGEKLTTKILTVDELRALPFGSVLRHDRTDTLVEVVNKPVLRTSGVRIGGSFQNWESLYPDWDFPMTLLYRPET